MTGWFLVIVVCAVHLGNCAEMMAPIPPFYTEADCNDEGRARATAKRYPGMRHVGFYCFEQALER